MRILFVATALALLAGCSGSKPPEPEAKRERQPAPDTFKVKFETSKGDIVLQIHKEWAPNGVDRFHELVTSGFFTEARFFRAIQGFMVQFGIHADPKMSMLWQHAMIPDDPVRQSNLKGRITFAKRGIPNTRTTQLFINLVDNSRLDAMGFAPIGEVVEGMDVVEKLYTGYGEGPPGGHGPAQDRIQLEGNPYLEREFPRLDYIKKATVL
jgi:peptidyl-prolyl cis-trans isomerase A (cyclophilin A)